MNKEYFGKTFCGPYLSTATIVNTGGLYLITPVIQTGIVQILDVRQTKNLVTDINNPEHQTFWFTLSRNFGGFAFFIHYEMNEFCRLQLLYQFHEKYNLPKVFSQELSFA
ncbi:MAG: hypothetical protein CL609_16215 [Anaerolineaceae bacterium]|nr:hypothetical protein [Anaerolineaceae bacterium]